jgi:hypothetical protein
MVLKGPENPIPSVPLAGLKPEEQDAALLEAVAQRVVRMGLAVPAVFFLESTKPLSYIGSQALVFLEPFVKSIFNLAAYDRFVALLEDRKNIEKLMQRIEELDEDARQEEKERKRLEKEQKRTGGGGPVRRPESLRSRLTGWLRRS